MLVTFGRLGDPGTPGRIKLQNAIWNLRKINPDMRLLIATRLIHFKQIINAWHAVVRKLVTRYDIFILS